MRVCSHGYGRFGGAGMEVVDGMHAGKIQGGSHVGRCRCTCHRWHPITPPSRCAALGRVEPELVGLPGMDLALDATRRLRFVVHTAGWLHSTVLHGHRCLWLLRLADFAALKLAMSVVRSSGYHDDVTFAAQRICSQFPPSCVNRQCFMDEFL